MTILTLILLRHDVHHSVIEPCRQLQRRHHTVGPAATATSSQPTNPTEYKDHQIWLTQVTV